MESDLQSGTAVKRRGTRQQPMMKHRAPNRRANSRNLTATRLDNEATFVEWVSEHRGIIVKVARSFTTTNEDRDDLIQEILIRVWASVESYEGHAKPSTWIYRVALNRALTWRRDESKHRNRKASLIEVGELPGTATAEAGEQLNDLYAQLRKLTEIDRGLLLLSLDGFSYREMAEITDLTETNVGARLTRARAKLQQLLAEDDS